MSEIKKIKTIEKDKKYLIELKSATKVEELIQNQHDEFIIEIPKIRKDKTKTLICINKINKNTNMSLIEKTIKKTHL